MGKSYSSEQIEQLIQDKIRERVLEKEFMLEERKKHKEIQDINISVLTEMTDILSKDEIEKIAQGVRDEFRTEDKPEESWYSRNSQVINAIIATAFLCLCFVLSLIFLGYHQYDSISELFFSIMFFGVVGFPFIIVLFGICYFFGGLFKKVNYKEQKRS